MSDTSSLRDRTKAYASRIIKLYAHLQQTHHFDDAAMVLAKQLLRSGTSVAANHREAKHTRSKADRIAKFNIILQELEESALWLELLTEHQMANAEGLRQLLDETNQLIGIFITSVKTLHGEQGKDNALRFTLYVPTALDAPHRTGGTLLRALGLPVRPPRRLPTRCHAYPGG